MRKAKTRKASKKGVHVAETQERLKLHQKKVDLTLKQKEEEFQLDMDMERHRHDRHRTHLKQKHDMELEALKVREALMFPSNGTKRPSKK